MRLGGLGWSRGRRGAASDLGLEASFFLTHSALGPAAAEEPELAGRGGMPLNLAGRARPNMTSEVMGRLQGPWEGRRSSGPGAPRVHILSVELAISAAGARASQPSKVTMGAQVALDLCVVLVLRCGCGRTPRRQARHQRASVSHRAPVPRLDRDALPIVRRASSRRALLRSVRVRRPTAHRLLRELSATTSRRSAPSLAVARATGINMLDGIFEVGAGVASQTDSRSAASGVEVLEHGRGRFAAEAG